MLPPVFASANAYANAPEVRQRSDQPVNARLPSTSMYMVSSEASQSSAIAGQLNMLMLSGPERMTRNLATLAEVLGSALRIERAPDEGLSDYMGRLIEGIASLPDSERLKLQKLLTQAFAGLQLRTLLDAMANPSGPERATLALYLELYRQPDKDAGTRSVISSYREVAAEGQENPLAPPRPIPANDGLRPGVGPLRSEPKPVLQTPSAPPTDGSSARDADTSSPGSATLPRAMPSAAQDPQRGSLVAQTKVALGLTERSVMSAPASVPAPIAEVAELRVTGETLRNAPNLASADSSGRQRSEGSGPTVQNQAVDSSGEAVRPGNGANDKAQAVDTAIQSLAHLPKPMLPLPAVWIAELLESDLIRSLMQLKTLSAEKQGGGPEISSAARQEPVAPSASPEAADHVKGEKSDEQATHSLQAARTAVQADETQLPPMTVPTEQTMLRPLVAREGVPLPFVFYMIEDEGQTEEVEEEEDAEERRQRKDEGREGDDAPGSQSDEASMAIDAKRLGDEDPADLPTALREGSGANPALPAPMDVNLHSARESAHELYLRMAGLT